MPSGNPVLPAIWENINSNKSRGAEITYRGSLENWQWDFSASYVDSKAVTTRGDIDYVVFPKQIYNINFGYLFKEQGIDVYIINRVHRNVKEGPTLLSFNPNVPDFVPNPADLKDYWNTDVTLNYNQENLNVQLGVHNIFDKENILPSVWSSENGLNQLGRTVSLSLEWRF